MLILSMACKHFSDLMKIQIDIIQRHIGEHQYFQHITDRNKAVADFIIKYAWLMRETYCLACPDKKECEYNPNSELYSNHKA